MNPHILTSMLNRTKGSNNSLLQLLMKNICNKLKKITIGGSRHTSLYHPTIPKV
jgi:hypothetical protein